MTKWIDRKFDFNFPVTKYPEFILKLKDTIPKLHFFVHSTRLDILTKRDDNHWSIQENIGHLYSTDGLFMGRLEDYLNKKSELRPDDLSGDRTNNEKYNELEIRLILKKFGDRRAEFLHKIDALDDKILERTAQHPRLKLSMRLCDMLYFQSEHDQHHLNRISDLIEQYEEEE